MDKKELKDIIIKQIVVGGISLVFLGLFAFGFIKYAYAQANNNNNIIYSSGFASVPEDRYEITTTKEQFASFNVAIKWSDNITEEIGTFQLFLGRPLKIDYGNGYENITTVLYYSPLQTIKLQKDVKLIVKPKKKRIRGDPVFYRGIDYTNETRLDRLKIEVDAVIYDEETDDLIYNFEIGIGDGVIPDNPSITEIIVTGENIREAMLP